MTGKEKKLLSEADYLIEQNGTIANFSGGVEHEMIVKIEHYLHMLFPNDYVYFLEKYGSGSFGGFEVYGITADISLKKVPNVIWVLKQLRKSSGLPSSFLPVAFDGIGAYYCLDLTSGEGSVVVGYDIYHDEGIVPDKGDGSVQESEDGNKLEHFICGKVSDSFAEFFLDSIKVELEDN